jgi:hypothetical protein
VTGSFYVELIHVVANACCGPHIAEYPPQFLNQFFMWVWIPRHGFRLICKASEDFEQESGRGCRTQRERDLGARAPDRYLAEKGAIR